jgi:AraC-like DNA-binding protein
MPLGEIAYQLGFSSQSHFTPLFRRLTATTPKAYRKSLTPTPRARDFGKIVTKSKSLKDCISTSSIALA